MLLIEYHILLDEVRIIFKKIITCELFFVKYVY